MTPLFTDDRTRFLHTTATAQPEPSPEIVNYYCDCDKPAVRIARNRFHCPECKVVMKVYPMGCVFYPEDDYRAEIESVRNPNIL